MSLWASTTAPKVPLDAADGDEAEPVRARFRERVSSPCGEDGEVETAGHPLGGGGCAALFPSSRCILEGRSGTGTREEPGTLTQGAPVFPGSSRLGIEPKTPGWLVQDPTTSPSGDLIPTALVVREDSKPRVGKSPCTILL